MPQHPPWVWFVVEGREGTFRGAVWAGPLGSAHGYTGRTAEANTANKQRTHRDELRRESVREAVVRPEISPCR